MQPLCSSPLKTPQTQPPSWSGSETSLLPTFMATCNKPFLCCRLPLSEPGFPYGRHKSPLPRYISFPQKGLPHLLCMRQGPSLPVQLLFASSQCLPRSAVNPVLWLTLHCLSLPLDHSSPKGGITSALFIATSPLIQLALFPTNTPYELNKRTSLHLDRPTLGLNSRPMFWI